MLQRFNPYVAGTDGASWVRLTPTLLGALLAVAGAVRRSRATLVVAFTIGFFPWLIGPYLLGTPGIFRWIAVAELAYLLAAYLLPGRR